MAASDVPDAGPVTWINRYKIQDRRSSRAITVPEAAPLAPKQTVWIWKHPSPNEDRTEYLRVSVQPPGESDTEPTDALCKRQGYTIRDHASGKLLTIPDGCDDDLFSSGSHVIVLGEQFDGGVPHLKVVPERIYRQKIAASAFAD